MPSCRFKHTEGDAMDGQVLRNANIVDADAIILGNAHDADPKDVSQHTHAHLCTRKRMLWKTVC